MSVAWNDHSWPYPVAGKDAQISALQEEKRCLQQLLTLAATKIHFDDSEVVIVLKAIEGRRTMIDDTETPVEDALIDKIYAYLETK